jgi:multidrug efflux pump subunit AcrA (membrane-fusion protein)
LLGLSLAAALVSCGKGPPPAAAPKSPEAAELRAQATVHLPAAATDAVGIKMAKAEMRESRSALRAVGKMLAPQTHMAIVSYFLPGRVAQVHVQAGDSVKKGQPLVTLECAEVCDGMSEF